MSATVSMPIGVIVERTELDNPWQDYSWKPVEAIARAVEVDGWRVLNQGKGFVRYHAATLPLELFHRETEGYKHNLSTKEPRLFIVLRPNEGDGEHEVEPFLVTACPYESQDYLDSGEEIVEGVPMPPEVADFISAFIEEHHVEEVFVKRKRKKHFEKEQRQPGRHRAPRGSFDA